MVVRCAVVLLTALALLGVDGGSGSAQAPDKRPRGIAAEATRQALDTEKIARERTRARRRAAWQADAADDLDQDAALDPFEGIDDPLDEIDEALKDDYDALDDAGEPAAALDLETGDATQGGDAAGTAGDLQRLLEDADENRGSLALDVYRAAERGLDELDSVRPYDSRDDAPGLDPMAPIDTGNGTPLEDAIDAGLDHDPSVKP